MDKRLHALAAAPLAFQDQYDALLDAYYSVDRGAGRAQRQLELQVEMAQLSAAHGELRRAQSHYETILECIATHHTNDVDAEPVDGQQQPRADVATDQAAASQAGGDADDGQDDEVPAQLRAVLVELEINALANLSTIASRLGDTKAAVAHLLKAKQALRELRAAPPPSEPSAEPPELEDRREPLAQLEATLTANYAVLLQAKGAEEDAAVAAQAALSLAEAAQETGDTTVSTARQLATQVLVSCARTRGESHRVRDLSVSLAHELAARSPRDPRILARSHNYLGLQCVENRELEAALRHFLMAHRAACDSSTPDDTPHLLGTLRYQIGCMLAALGTTTSLSVVGDTTATEQVDARQCLTPTTVSDRLVALLARASLAELAYHDGDFATAETTLAATLAELRQLVATEEPTRPLAAKHELAKIEGYMESWLGTALLAAGSDALAEEAHQRDLELALDSGDLHAQLRALRNLALVYSSTQRFAEAATLWRETLEIAAVLASKRDQMVAYGALGSALHALGIVDSTATGESSGLLAEPEHQPRALFLQQRALAVELGDVEAQARAQRGLVGTYEWQPCAEELEKRLEACDALVRLSEQLPHDATLGADAYRSLANAINAQVARLAERGQRFAEAIKVLTAKRNAALQKLREASARATSASGHQPRRQAWAYVEIVRRPLAS